MRIKVIKKDHRDGRAEGGTGLGVVGGVVATEPSVLGEGGVAPGSCRQFFASGGIEGLFKTTPAPGAGRALCERSGGGLGCVFDQTQCSGPRRGGLGGFSRV
jgi:hypothetical protein